VICYTSEKCGGGVSCLKVREVRDRDLAGLLELYTYLHNNSVPQIDSIILEIWNKILSDSSHHIIVGLIDEKIVSSCVLVIVPNLTRNQRPYALIENVVSHEQYRGRGYATELLNYAKELALRANCYKIMLSTSSKEESTLNFYRKAGFNSEDKTAFVQWL
jgi:GNAT superfamily N-acetyltransferase